MPTLLTVNGFRFFFYSNEGDEPIHVHVTKGDGVGKIWLDPSVAVAYMDGFSSKEQKKIWALVTEHTETFKQKWNEYFA